MIFGIVAVVAILFYAASRATAAQKSRPNKGDLFACSACGRETKHDTRTLNGYDKGVRKSFLCWECFKKKKDAEAASAGPSGRESSSGCLGVALVLASTGLFASYKLVGWMTA